VSNSGVVPDKNSAPAQRPYKIPKIWANHGLKNRLAAAQLKSTNHFVVCLTADQQ
jgi:hypothetical protein